MTHGKRFGAPRFWSFWRRRPRYPFTVQWFTLPYTKHTYSNSRRDAMRPGSSSIVAYTEMYTCPSVTLQQRYMCGGQGHVH